MALVCMFVYFSDNVIFIMIPIEDGIALTGNRSQSKAVYVMTSVFVIRCFFSARFVGLISVPFGFLISSFLSRSARCVKYS